MRWLGGIKLTKLGISLGLASLVLTGCQGSSETADHVLHYTTYSSPNSDQSRTMQRWAEDVTELTDGDVEIRFHYSQSLVDADDVVPATRDGRADIAHVATIYAESDLPLYTAVGLPFETENTEAHMESIQRLYEESPEYRESFEQQGIQQLFPLPIGNAVVGSSQPITEVADFQGQSLRGGGLLSRVLISAGANPVSMAANDIYESMERGVVDGYTSLALANLETFGLADASPYITDMGVGAYSSSIVVINEQLFEDLPKEHQAALNEASSRAIQYGLEEMGDEATLNCDIAQEAGAELEVLPDDEVEQLRTDLSLEEIWLAETSERGYPAETVLEAYREILSEEESNSNYVDPFNECMERS